MHTYIQVAELFQWLEAAAVQKERDDERLVALEVCMHTHTHIDIDIDT
jgi:hypothetical protein